ncbi:MAG: protein-L-isoaspartate O-methyltransferase [Burkholderiales bacterium]|nr:MAG: protein-L-isoaspartate O-methyltransferase [Burkholderiales bacterium]
MDFERARYNMVEQQIRTWEVLDQEILDLLFVVKREEFVPSVYRALAFTDMEIPLTLDGRATGENMLAPRVEARMLQGIRVRKHEVVLEIGAGSGYMAALLAHRARHVTTVEILPELAEFAQANLRRAGVLNATVQTGSGAHGWNVPETYDVIVFSGSVPFVPEIHLQQLNIGGRLAAIVGEAPVMTAQIVTRVTDTSYGVEPLFDTSTRPLVGFPQREKFRF